MKRQHFFWLLCAIFASSFIVAACTDDGSLLQPQEPAASESSTAAIPSSPLSQLLDSGQCMGDDAVNNPGLVSGFGTNPNAFNCTANDVRIANARTASGDPIQCALGDQIQVNLVADVVETSTSVRHDIGIWIAEDGGNAETGECSFYWFDDDDVDLLPGVPIDADGDMCGDMDNAGSVIDFPLDALTLTCTAPLVIEGETFLEINSCVSWTQPGGDRTCPADDNGPDYSPNYRGGTLPANKSKCNCEPFLVPVEIVAQLTLEKTVINDDGGTAVETDFQAYIDGNPVDWDAPEQLVAGTYTASEDVVTGYTAGSWGGDCAADGSVTLAPGDSKTCTITNDDQPAFLTLEKTVTNDDGGTAVEADFQAYIDGSPVDWDVAQSVGAGSFTASEDVVTGYTAGSWGGDCAADGSVTLALGESKTCTITNDDQPATLTLEKTVINDDGGTAVEADFQAYIDGSPVPWSAAQSVTPGSHTASEDVVTNYTAGPWGGDCAADGSVTVALGENKTCTITNDDDPVGEPGNSVNVRLLDIDLDFGDDLSGSFDVQNVSENIVTVTTVNITAQFKPSGGGGWTDVGVSGCTIDPSLPDNIAVGGTNDYTFECTLDEAVSGGTLRITVQVLLFGAPGKDNFKSTLTESV
jgi:hypothetical protein